MNVNREQRTETAIEPKWYVSGEGALHLAVAVDPSADGSVVRGACGTWFTASDAYDDSQGIALGAVGDACLAIAMGIS